MTFTSDLHLMEMHVEALFTHDENGRILRARYGDEPDEESPAPQFFLGRTKIGNVWRFRHDLPDDLVRKLDGLASSEPVTDDLRGNPINFEAFWETLRAHAEIQQVYGGPAYRFPDNVKRPANAVRITKTNAELLRFGFADEISKLRLIQPCMVVVEGGRAVSACCSVRTSSRASEAGVETLEGFRGRGYATDAVAGWALAVRELGRIPLYSTWWENAASQGVAKKLGLVLYGVDLHFT